MLLCVPRNIFWLHKKDFQTWFSAIVSCLFYAVAYFVMLLFVLYYIRYTMYKRSTIIILWALVLHATVFIFSTSWVKHFRLSGCVRVNCILYYVYVVFDVVGYVFIYFTFLFCILTIEWMQRGLVNVYVAFVI